MTERAEIQWGTTPIPFVVERSNRRRTVALTMHDGHLVVTAPAEVSLVRLKDVVRAKARWVVQRQRLAAERPAPLSTREFVTGETVYYRGRQLRLRVLTAPEPADVRIVGAWIEVTIPPLPRVASRRLAVRVRLAEALRAHARRVLPVLLAELCEKHGITPPTMLVREPQKRWGSCDASGVLRISWRIVQAPRALMEYVLMHELVHLEHFEHGEAFWATLGRRMPDYEARRERLREMGAGLVW